MPGFQDETMAVADVYAASLLAAAQESGQADEVAAELADLVSYFDRDPEFERFLTAAGVDDEPRRVSLEKLFRGKMNDLLLNLLQVLNNRNRLLLVRPIERRVRLRMMAARNEQEVLVESAHPLNERLRELIRRTLRAETGKEPILSERLCPELIGGIVMHMDGMQIDASVADQIQRLRKRLLQRAGAEVNKNRREMMEA